MVAQATNLGLRDDGAFLDDGLMAVRTPGTERHGVVIACYDSRRQYERVI